jgi:hypothetical protein
MVCIFSALQPPSSLQTLSTQAAPVLEAPPKKHKKEKHRHKEAEHYHPAPHPLGKVEIPPIALSAQASESIIHSAPALHAPMTIFAPVTALPELHMPPFNSTTTGSMDYTEHPVVSSPQIVASQFMLTSAPLLPPLAPAAPPQPEFEKSDLLPFGETAFSPPPAELPDMF